MGDIQTVFPTGRDYSPPHSQVLPESLSLFIGGFQPHAVRFYSLSVCLLGRDYSPPRRQVLFVSLSFGRYIQTVRYQFSAGDYRSIRWRDYRSRQWRDYKSSQWRDYKSSQQTGFIREPVLFLTGVHYHTGIDTIMIPVSIPL